MVFSHSSQKTPNFLKMVDIDRLKAEKNLQADAPIGEEFLIKNSTSTPSSLRSELNFAEDILTLNQPLDDNTMFQNTDCEFFQDLGLWCSTIDKDEETSIIDLDKPKEKKAHNTDTLYAHSPQGCDVIDANTPASQYEMSLKKSISPDEKNFSFDYSKKGDINEVFLDINSLPIVFGDLPDENPTIPTVSLADQISWVNTHDTNGTTTQINTLPFMDQEDSLEHDMKVITWSNDLITKETKNNEKIISEYVIHNEELTSIQAKSVPMLKSNLKLDIDTTPQPLPVEAVVNTPDVLNCIEQLEMEKFNLLTYMEEKSQLSDNWSVQDDFSFASPEACSASVSAKNDEYELITPKTESYLDSDFEDTKSNISGTRRKRCNSEESDETYTPYLERSTRKYKRRKRNVPIGDMILALEETQKEYKTRRGRPPKRRDSTLSMASTDEISRPTQEVKYRELRDKNNEASKRSRMNRKLKELQMEQFATELEERNKKLKVKADILEDMTKRLKNALMTAILQK